MEDNFDFHGWATKNNIKCSDGRTILKDAFAHCDGAKVPLVWNHSHNDPANVLGHAMLENREEGVYVHGTFNDTESGQLARTLVQHGDITSLSIYANQLQQQGPFVKHGTIREVSLVYAGANPGAFIEDVIRHSDDGTPVVSEDEAQIFTGEQIVLQHSSDTKKEDEKDAEDKKTDDSDNNEKTVSDVIDSMTDEQKVVMHALIGRALGISEDESDDTSDDETEDASDEKKKPDNIKHSEEGGNFHMKKNVFDNEDVQNDGVLSHSDEVNIINMAKQNNVGSLQTAIKMFAENEDRSLAHGIDNIEQLFPDYQLVRPGAPELIERDLTWVDFVMRGTHKSPISRIRTRQADARAEDLRAHGYKGTGSEKTVSGNIKLLTRTTDPQTIYRKDAMHRDDIIDITDFDVVEYQWGIMRRNLEEEIARAILVGDGREDGEEMKIDETHVRSIWNDDELYTIHADVDIEAARAELQGSDTSKHFGDNYIYSEAIITASLYAREQYKGSGSLEFYCTPHLLNVMLLARDLNGRRIYSSKADLAAALNVTAINTVEQFEGLVRKDADSKSHKLLGLFVNLSDYQVGSTKGGEITKFDQFDIDFNQYKYLIETRISGALTKIKSAIALEEPVTE